MSGVRAAGAPPQKVGRRRETGKGILDQLRRQALGSEPAGRDLELPGLQQGAVLGTPQGHLQQHGLLEVRQELVHVHHLPQRHPGAAGFAAVSGRPGHQELQGPRVRRLRSREHLVHAGLGGCQPSRIGCRPRFHHLDARVPRQLPAAGGVQLCAMLETQPFQGLGGVVFDVLHRTTGERRQDQAGQQQEKSSHE